MDELQLLREMRRDVGTPPQATLARGRNKLVNRVESKIKAANRRGGWKTLTKRAGFATTAAAVLVAGFVVADVTGESPRPGAAAEAAEILDNAAATTIKTSDPAVKPGQFLKVDTKAVYASTTTRADGTAVSWLDTTGGQVYIPGDLSGEWVWNREPRVPATFFGEESKAEAERLMEAMKTENSGPQLEGILRGKGGDFYGSPQRILDMPLPEAVKTLPREPQALLDLIYLKTKGKGPSAEKEALTTIASSLRTGVIPADLRAAMYKAAALIPGVVVADKQATLDGRQGIALGVAWAGGKFREDIIIDPATGLLIGERTVYLVAESGIPANTASSWTAVRTSVVDSAP
ncbi:CU044_5270 family protein [Paenarthrobacter sp. NPDC090520]|uniref:CU044_5270 family protein n=1 Tax=Paenarthrobacter sp. NPDC090520 TaxID=3364382 RepID=UPI003810E3F5